MKKKALILGITGQGGSYLSELLLSKDYEIYGLIRRVAHQNQNIRLDRISHILNDITLIPGSLESLQSLYKAISMAKPDECYHLAAQSDVKESFDDEFSTMQTNVQGTHNILSVIKDIVPECKFLFAASSEMFGEVTEAPQDENTPFNPQSPYAISKAAGLHLTKFYRKRHKLFACNGIFFNHESSRRGLEFVTRKIARAAAEIALGKSDLLHLGNVSARRDWGHTPDYMRAAWLMLQYPKPDDYVIATGETHTVAEFAKEAFNVVNLDWTKHTIVNNRNMMRPTDVRLLRGNPGKAKKVLNWEAKVKFEELVKIMVEAELVDIRSNR